MYGTENVYGFLNQHEWVRLLLNFAAPTFAFWWGLQTPRRRSRSGDDKIEAPGR